MSDAMATRGENLVRRVVQNYSNEVDSPAIDLRENQGRIEATCGSDFIVHEHHKLECNNSDCEGCSHACVQANLATYKPTGSGRLLQELRKAGAVDQETTLLLAVRMRDVLRDTIAAGAAPGTSIQYLLQCIEYWVDSKQIDRK